MWFAEGQQGELGRRRINARGSGVRGKNGRGACLSRAESGEPREAARHVLGRQHLLLPQRTTLSGSSLCKLSKAICPLLGLGNGSATQIKWCESRLLTRY